ncbi:MAG: hypothetical protein PUP91_05955 [Rhizonema sp. PD37]|nr:hypothetical protein [Rhizonema sp. PD37]
MQFLVIARVVEGISIEQVLPHVQAEAEAGILKFEILPLMPYTGLESLFAKAK